MPSLSPLHMTLPQLLPLLRHPPPPLLRHPPPPLLRTRLLLSLPLPLPLPLPLLLPLPLPLLSGGGGGAMISKNKVESGSTLKG